MKNWMIITLCICLAVSVTACSQRGDTKEFVPQSQSAVENPSTPEQPEADTSENSESGLPESKSIAEPLEGTTQISFSAPVVNEMGTILEETVDFSMYLPKDWTIADLEVSENGRKVAEVLPARIVYNKSEPFEDTDFAYAEAITVRDITAGQFQGKYYHMQTSVEMEGLTALDNELIYCLNTGDRIILIVFSPAYGIGLGTQNEQFASFLNTIQLSSSNDVAVSMININKSIDAFEMKENDTEYGWTLTEIEPYDTPPEAAFYGFLTFTGEVVLTGTITHVNAIYDGFEFIPDEKSKGKLLIPDGNPEKDFFVSIINADEPSIAESISELAVNESGEYTIVLTQYSLAYVPMMATNNAMVSTIEKK